MNEPVKKMSYAIAQSATILTILAVLSPLAGLALEMVLAWRFGASGTIDAFRIGSLVLAFGNQLFFGQLLPHVIVPLFLKYRESGSEQEGWRLAFSLFEILGFVSLIFVLWIWFNPEVLVKLLGPGLSATSRTDLIFFIRYFSFVFLLMVWSGIISSILYVFRVFWLSSASQFLTNVFVIFAIFLTGKELGSKSLVVGTIMGALVIAGLHFFFILRLAQRSNIYLLACFKIGPREGIKTAMRLSIPLIGIIFIDQWGIIIINRALSGMSPGTLANFGYAWKLLMLVGILPANLATVIFPEFSKVQASKNTVEFSRLVTKAVRMTLLLTIPLGVVLFVIRAPLISLIFERGAMSSGALKETSQLFGILLVLAPAGALTAILYKVAFSLRDTKSPAILGFISALLITIVVPYVAGVAGENGVGWALSVITWASTLGLFAYLIWRYRVMYPKEIIWYFCLLAAISTGIGLSSMVIKGLFESNTSMVISMKLVELTLITLVSSLLGYGLSQLLGIKESSDILNFIRWQYNKIRYNIRSL